MGKKRFVTSLLLTGLILAASAGTGLRQGPEPQGGSSAIAMAPASAAPEGGALYWQIETVPVGSSEDLGQSTSLALDSMGYPRMSYYDRPNHAPEYTYYDGSGWQVTRVDSSGDVGEFSSLALDAHGRPHISYYDATNYHLKYAYHDGSDWQVDTVDDTPGVGWYTSLALDSAGLPHISYSGGDSLSYAHFDGTHWMTETVDSGAVGTHTSLALDSQDRPRIAYLDYGSSDLKYAYSVGYMWQVGVVDRGNVDGHISLAVDSTDSPHISYHNVIGRDLVHAYVVNSAWYTETVDSAGTVGAFTSLALDEYDHPHISYCGYTYLGYIACDDVRYARYDGNTWTIDFVDSSGGVGMHTSLARDAGGRPHISYDDGTTGKPKYAVGSSLPLELRRRAIQFLEQMRFSGLAPGWEQAQLGAAGRLLYQPGVVGPAYVEYRVLAGDWQPAGFIILSTGQHEYPVAHWSHSGEPPTYALEVLAGAQGETAAKFYKLDSLGYAAENAQGERVAILGEQPFKITGLDPAWLDQPPGLTEEVWVPDEQPADDSDVSQISGTLTISGTTPPPSLQIEGWSSWDELKGNYADVYQLQNEWLHRDAARAWEVEGLLDQYGQVLYEGDTALLPLLWATETYTPTGEGVDYVQIEKVERAGTPPVLQVTAIGSYPGEQLPVHVDVRYPNGLTEQANYLVVGFYRVMLPLVLRNVAGGRASSLTVAPGLDAEVGRWHVYWADPGPVQGLGTQAVDASNDYYYEYWAGDEMDQRLYWQLPAHYGLNTWDCSSGCGATGWAMLFGWADNQAAEGNSYWAPRWGIYRENGGYGKDVAAPRDQDLGVMSMTLEIRRRIGTFCVPFEQGATWPWEMKYAYRYLYDRSSTKLTTDYNAVLFPEDRLRQLVRNSIRDRRTPAIIGTNWHYPLAYGYAWRARRVCFVSCWLEYDHWFFVNQGWYGNERWSWLTARTWFAGQIYPNW